jgi:carboxylate-amine ligase
VAALATSPVPVEPELVGKSRYLQMARAFGLTAYEQLTCGCHVHVGVSSEQEGVAALAGQSRMPGPGAGWRRTH